MRMSARLQKFFSAGCGGVFRQCACRSEAPPWPSAHQQSASCWLPALAASCAHFNPWQCHHSRQHAAAQLQSIIDTALDLKAARARLRGDPDASRPLAGRMAVLLFAVPCLHTRVAFETVRVGFPVWALLS